MQTENTKDLSKYVAKYLPRIPGSTELYTNPEFLLAIENAVLSFTRLFVFFFPFSYFL